MKGMKISQLRKSMIHAYELGEIIRRPMTFSYLFIRMILGMNFDKIIRMNIRMKIGKIIRMIFSYLFIRMIIRMKLKKTIRMIFPIFIRMFIPNFIPTYFRTGCRAVGLICTNCTCTMSMCELYFDKVVRRCV